MAVTAFESLSGHCAELASPNIVNFVFSLLILFGIFFSYLPQHYRIVKRRTSEAISPYFILLGSTSCTCGLANILLLPASRGDLACCKHLGAFPCVAGILGVLQVGVQWSCFTLVLLLFLLFFPRQAPSSTHRILSSTHPTYGTAVLVTVISIITMIVLFILTLYYLFVRPDSAYLVASTFGLLSLILSALQYIPQIWTTFNLQRVGSLSIPMMCIQTPGSFVWGGSLAARYGLAGWSSYAVYFMTGTLQGCLLVMAITFELRDRKKKNSTSASEDLNEPDSPNEGPIRIVDNEVEGRSQANESTPLLGNGRA